jgi:hemolysin III
VTATEAPPKPLLRGWIHQVAFFLAIPAGAALILAAPTTRARTAVTIFALGLVGMYGVSAAYHRFPWDPRAKRVVKRLDHSMIFVLIAGTYTPFSLLVLHGAFAVALLVIVWAGAALGIALKVTRIDRLDVIAGALYIILGWLVVAAAPQLIRGLTATEIALTAIGGILYTLGAIVLAGHRPDPNPRVFGYHEVWHVMTVAGAACHYSVIMLVLRSMT